MYWIYLRLVKEYGVAPGNFVPYGKEPLEINSKLSLADAQDKYNDVIGDFPI